MKILLLVVLAFIPLADTADAQLEVHALPESRITIEGRSNLSRFECTGQSVEGVATILPEDTEARLRIPVGTFDCGKARMTADFQKAMKASEHPYIQFDLTELQRIAKSSPVETTVAVEGGLAIAGVVKTVTFDVHLRKVADDMYRIRASESMKMTDFGIEPPVVFAGLIRTRDRIAVDFDLLAVTERPVEVHLQTPSLPVERPISTPPQRQQ